MSRHFDVVSMFRFSLKFVLKWQMAVCTFKECLKITTYKCVLNVWFLFIIDLWVFCLFLGVSDRWAVPYTHHKNINKYAFLQPQFTQRRMSDPSSGIGSFVRGGFRKAISMKKSRSETENVDHIGTADCPEVEAGTLQEGFNHFFLTSVLYSYEEPLEVFEVSCLP